MSTTITIHGKVTRKPDLARTTSGLETCTVTVAVKRTLAPKGSAEPNEITSHFNVKAFGSLARNANASLAKGTYVTITGRLDQRSWETPRGETRTALEIVADDIAASLKWASIGVVRSVPAESPPLVVAPPLAAPPLPALPPVVPLSIVGGRR